MNRPLCFTLAFVQWFVLAALALILLGWLLGRFLTDQYAWSQWLWWIPTLGAIAAVLLLTALIGLPFAWGRADRGSRRRRAVVVSAVGLLAIAGYFFLVEHRYFSLSSARAGSTAEVAGPGVSFVHWNLGQMPPPRQRAEHAQALFNLRADVLVLTAPNGILWHDSLRDYLREGEQMIQLGKFLIITRFAVGAPAFISQEGDQQITVLPIDTREALGTGIVIWMADFPSQPRIPRMAFARELRALIEKRPLPPPDVVVGDFNLTRGSASIDVIFDGLDLHHAYDDAGRGYSASFPRAPLPLWHIDHIFLGPALRAVQYELVDPGIGRHMAQRAMLRSSTSDQPR